MAAAILLWLAAAATLAMLFVHRVRNAGLLGLAGTILALLSHYNIGTVPELNYLAILLWLGAAALLISKSLAKRRREIA